MQSQNFIFLMWGVANYLGRKSILDLKGPDAGRSFEHFILMELMAYKSYQSKRFNIGYWQTKLGLEVDFVLGEAQLAVEVKINDHVHKSDIKGLLAFCEEHPQAKGIVVSRNERARKLVNGSVEILILPWQTFLNRLWSGKFDDNLV